MNRQTYKYISENSIIYNLTDDYFFSDEEYRKLHMFFVTYSMCGSQSHKKRMISDYGWQNLKDNSSASITNSGLKTQLEKILKLDQNEKFIFTENDDLKESFEKVELFDESSNQLLYERAVVGYTRESNKYYKLFYRIRNALAHGRFSLKYNINAEKMIIIQDNDRNNVTARIVLKLDTIMKIIDVVDKNKLLERASIVINESKSIA